MAATSSNVAPGDETHSQADRFLRSALAILGETGRTDFTVLEVVERSKTSLRAFYQHFTTKDELLLALVDRLMDDSTARWRAEIAPMPADQALHRLIDEISTPTESAAQDSITRGLTSYHDRLLRSRPREFATVLAPLHALLVDILSRGIAEGVFRADIDVETDATILMQTALAAPRLRELGSELIGLPIDGGHLHAFCARSLRHPDQA